MGGASSPPPDSSADDECAYVGILAQVINAACTQFVCSTMPPKQEQGVLWWTQPGEPVNLPCVDCGLITGNFCDGGPALNYRDRCYAYERDPRGYPYPQSTRRTPLCAYCETAFFHCRFCRGEKGCTPPTRRVHWSGTPEESGIPNGRHFTSAVADWITEIEFEVRETAAREEEQRRASQARRRVSAQNQPPPGAYY